VHIDTHYKIPEMIEYRDRLAKEMNLYMIYGENRAALDAKNTFPDGAVSRVECCRQLKTEALTHTLDGSWPRYRLNLQTGEYELDSNTAQYTGVIVGARADEEGSRSKERYFSPRDQKNDWDLDDQPPEFWNQFKTDFAPGTHVRIHPLLDWTELNVWEYIQRENIPTVSLYYNQGDGTRYRSLGCAPCTGPIKSESRNVQEIIDELRAGALSNIAERSGRAQDAEDGGGLETLRRNGYM
jgi:sulfate adenylyltransferase subunit 2